MSLERKLREEQDAAYQRSLEADRAKKALQQMIIKESQPLARNAPPVNYCGTDGIKVSLQLPDRKLPWSFDPRSPASAIYDLVFENLKINDFTVKALHPEAVLIPDDSSPISSLNLRSPQRLIVELTKPLVKNKTLP